MALKIIKRINSFVKRSFPETMQKMQQMQIQMGELANAVNGLENKVIILQQENESLKENVTIANNTILDLHEPIEHMEKEKKKLIADASYDIDKVYEMLEKKAPQAFRIYKKLMNNGSDEYEKESSSSCAVEGDIESIRFSKFMKRYIHGNILDVGCGPIEFPIYLKGYPIECIYGLDPLMPYKKHPFEFVQGVAEAIPWEANVFDTVIFATSFDHIFMVDLVMEEVDRVLADDGYLLMWVSFDENAKPYNPFDCNFKPHDKYHMFQNSKKDYEDLMQERFEIVEYYKSNINTHFYAIRKRGIQ